VKELQIKEKEEELAYYKNEVDKIEKEILELKNK
jgi:predicted transcriptional regulator